MKPIKYFKKWLFQVYTDLFRKQRRNFWSHFWRPALPPWSIREDKLDIKLFQGHYLTRKVHKNKPYEYRYRNPQEKKGKFNQRKTFKIHVIPKWVLSQVCTLKTKQYPWENCKRISNPTPCHPPYINEDISYTKPYNAHSSVIPNSQKMKINCQPQMSKFWYIIQYKLRNRRKSMDTWNNLDHSDQLRPYQPTNQPTNRQIKNLAWFHLFKIPEQA